MRLFLFRIVTAIVATTLTAIVLEGLLRAGVFGDAGRIPDLVSEKEYAGAHWHQPGRDFTWNGQAGRQREFSVASRWNALGYNDSEYSFDKPPGVVRIVVVGDSYVEAVQVPRDRSFHKLLEASLNRNASPPTRYEVIGLGWSSFGPAKSLAALGDVGMRFHPDVVVFEFLGFNDVSDDSAELTAAFNAQMSELAKLSSRIYLPELYRPTSEWARRLHVGDSRLAVFLAQGWNDIVFKLRFAAMDAKKRFPLNYYAFKREYDPGDPFERAWLDGWNSTLASIAEAKKLSEAGGAKFLLVHFTERWRVEPGGMRDVYTAYPALAGFDMDLEKDSKLVDEFTREHGIDMLSLFPAFREHWSDERPLHFRYDGHWTEAGHEVAAAAIEQKLRQSGWITGQAAR